MATAEKAGAKALARAPSVGRAIQGRAGAKPGRPRIWTEERQAKFIDAVFALVEKGRGGKGMSIRSACSILSKRAEWRDCGRAELQNRFGSSNNPVIRLILMAMDARSNSAMHALILEALADERETLRHRK